MNKLFDEKMNIQLTNIAYALAERDILKAVVGCLEKTDDRKLFEDLDLKQLLADCFEEALDTYEK